jgi:hypothetical protein
MRLLGGILMLSLAAMIGIVEFRAIVDPAVAQDVARKFAEHDPFPRLPWDMHVIFVFGFLLLLGAGLHFIFRRKGDFHARI